jgi:hypothetical protein
MEAQLFSEFQPVELYLACRTLKDKDFFSKSDPLVKCSVMKDGKWCLVGKTEQIQNNLNPNFQKTIQTELIFEIKQPIKFEVVDVDAHHEDLIGYAETELGKLAGAKKQTTILDLTDSKGKKGGKIIIRLDKSAQSNEFIFWQWAGVKLKNVDGLFDKSDPYLKFMRQSENGDLFLAHQTKHIMDNLNPIWDAFEIPAQKLCYGKHDSKIVVECWDWEKKHEHKFIGKTAFSLDDILKGQKEFSLLTAKGKPAGTLKLTNFNLVQKPSFMDFIRGGEQLSFILAVDFTGSNGVPSNPSSLHYVNPNGQPNQYQSAITAVGEIILNYDYDRMVPAFGFGAKPHFPTLNSPQVVHCFPLNGNPQSAEVADLPGLIQSYNNALFNVELSGPTYFQYVISGALEVAKANVQRNIYSCLLIITDGEIHDMQQTIDLIVAASTLPLSIIIIGVGNETFENMRQLDCDNGSLTNSKGQKASRDLVQFVCYNDYGGNKAQLAKEVLAELPKQLCEYKRIVGLKPNNPVMVDIQQM